MGRTDEQSLFMAWRGGDAAAGERLLAGYQEMLTGFFSRRRAPRVEDLVQETLLVLIRARDVLEDARALRSYVYVTARRLLAREIHEFRRWASPVEPSTLVDESDFVGWCDLGKVGDALREHDGCYTQAVRMYFLGEERGPAIAHRLGVPEGTVRSRIRRGLAQLRQAVVEGPPRPVPAP